MRCRAPSVKSLALAFVAGPAQAQRHEATIDDLTAGWIAESQEGDGSANTLVAVIRPFIVRATLR